MTVPSPYVPPQYVGNGITTIFAFSSPFFAPSDLVVNLFNTSTNVAVSPAAVLNGAGTYDYTVTGVQDANTGEYLAGGSITFNTAPPANFRITIYRSVVAQQNVALGNNTSFPAKTVEGALDRNMMIIQQLLDGASRDMRAPISDVAPSMILPPAAQRASMFAAFDAGGNIVVTSLTGVQAVVAATSLEVFVSKSPSLAAADSAAVILGASLVIDQLVTLAGNTTLNAKTIRFAGGIITRGAFNLTIAGEVVAGDVAIFDKAGAGTVAIAKGTANVAWFAPTADGVTDDSVPFNKVFALNRPVRIPAASYACNATLPNQVICRGDGDRVSVIIPFSLTTAAFTYNAAHSFQFASIFEAIGWVGPSGGNGTGVGFSMGATDPANYTSGMENIGNVTFNNCRWVGLQTGVLCNYGNIGNQWNDCQLQANYYGAYFLNNKFGAGMHAGCKYFRGGEISGNKCGIYVNNTQDGFGAIDFNGTIFENNVVAVFGYHNSGSTMIGPFAFRQCWNEINGNLSSGNPSSVTLDVWTGTVKTTQALVPHSFIFDGDCVHATFDSGDFSDCWLRATNSIVISQNDRVEASAGYGGNPCVVTSPNTSRIIIRDPSYNAGGTGSAPGVVVEGAPNQTIKDISLVAGAPGRSNIIPRRSGISALLNLTGVSAHFDAASNFTGSKTLTGVATVGSTLYPHYNAYSDTVTNAQFTHPAVCNMSLSTGFWVVTFELMVSAGSPIFKYWDQSTNVFMSLQPPVDSVWHTYGGIGYVASGTPAMVLDVTGSTGGAVTQTFGISAFQCWRFDTYAEAQDHLRSRMYIP